MKRRRFSLLALAVALLLTAGCGMDALRSALSERIEMIGSPRLHAFSSMYEVDRPALGLSPLPRRGSVKIVQRFGRDAKQAGYDALLRFGGPREKDLQFALVDGRYQWIGEIETHWGPRTFPVPGGRRREEITISYHAPPAAGVPEGLTIFYRGQDPAIPADANLSPAAVRPVLQVWDSLRAAHRWDD